MPAPISPRHRLGMLNENMSGHATFHRNLERAITDDGRWDHVAVDAPPRRPVRRALTAAYPMPRGWDADAALFRNQVGQSIATRRIVRELVAECDVVHLYSQNVSPLNVDLLRRRPLVVTTDCTSRQATEKYPFRYPGRGSATGVALAERVERRLLRIASTVLTQSEWARRGFVEQLGLTPDRVRVARLGAPVGRAFHRREPDGITRVTFTGATMRRKGGWLAIEALTPRLGVDVELTLVTPEPVAPRPGLVVRNDVRPGDGKIDDILARTDVFVLPTDSDMTPNAIFEAMAHGLPVVSTRSGGIPEMVDDGDSGRLVPTGDVRALRGALDQLVDDSACRERMGRHALHLLATRFGRAANLAVFFDALDRAVDAGLRPGG